jgi:hypothetical protein
MRASFVYVITLQVEGKPKILPTWEMRQSMPLGNNVYSLDSICFLTVTPSRPSQPLILYFYRTWNPIISSLQLYCQATPAYTIYNPISYVQNSFVL